MIAGTRAGSITSQTTSHGIKWSGSPRNGMPASKPYVYGATRKPGTQPEKQHTERPTLDDYLAIGGPDLTREQAAAKLGVSRRTIAHWRRRLRDMAGEA